MPCVLTGQTPFPVLRTYGFYPIKINYKDLDENCGFLVLLCPLIDERARDGGRNRRETFNPIHPRLDYGLGLCPLLILTSGEEDPLSFNLPLFLFPCFGIDGFAFTAVFAKKKKGLPLHPPLSPTSFFHTFVHAPQMRYGWLGSWNSR